MEVKPLPSLDALLSWDGPGDLKEILESLPPLAPRSPPVSTLQLGASPSVHFRTLVCHDMKGGYLDDRFCFGTGNADAYRFYHWAALDTFVYFSHKFITIPPCGWIHTAHIHGVKVLGTIITEWKTGESIWDVILTDDSIMERAINNLVEIACTYKFEGWLLNVETKVDPEKMNNLVYFTKQLTERMLHKNADAEVIWYDSVTCEGELKWQDQLNDKNKCFFDVCDGIFLNYTWKEEDLVETVKNAGDRLADVYVGIDVFGRNFYEGGGFNCHKALELIRKYNLSAAIFAQGWTYQVLGAENFFANENKLWEILEPFLLYHGPAQLPLRTSFCQGFGRNLYHRGKVVEEGDWYNLSRQQTQPVWEEVSRLSSSLCSVSTDDSFSGGSCLTLWVDDITTIRVMVCKIRLVPSMDFIFAYKVKGSMKYLSFNFTFELENENEISDKREMRFVAETSEADLTVSDETILPKTKKEENGWLIKEYFVPGRVGWITSFKIKAEGPALVMFGEVSVKQAEES